MAARTGGLGKGLDLLFGAGNTAEKYAGDVTRLDINEIDPNREQPRKNFEEEALESLAQSIRAHGVIAPLAVRKKSDGRYQIIAGERRYRAARRAGLDELPVIVLDATDEELLELAMIENLQREDLDPLEEAEGYRALTQVYGLTQEAVAERVGRSRPAVANALRLLELSPEVKNFVRSGVLSAGHGRALLPIENPRLQLQTANLIIAREYTVRQAEALVKKIKAGNAESKPAGDGVDYGKELGRELSDALGRGVTVRPAGGNRGRVVLEYYDLDDLDRLISLLKGAK